LDEAARTGRRPPPWDAAAALAEQRGRFAALGLDYDAGLARLDRALAAQGRAPYDEDRGTASAHWIAFAALALQRPAKRILEVGAYDGETARLLVSLFPDAHVTTVDLPHDDPRFAALYARDQPERLARFVELQRANTSDPRIELVLLDSFLLPERVRPGFDLVWVDGAHRPRRRLGPLQRVPPGGRGRLDPVRRRPRAARGRGLRLGQTGLLRGEGAIRRLGVVEVGYLLKRLGARWSADPRRRKHVAVLRKRASTPADARGSGSS
jgi:hypothetical protein